MLKEARDLSRDRRTMTNVFFMGALFGPFLAMGILALTISIMIEESERALSIPAQGTERVPMVVDRLKLNDIALFETTDDLETLVSSQQYQIAVRFPENLAEAYQSGRPAFVEVIFDSSSTKSEVQRDRVSAALGKLNSEIGALRLLMRGIDPSLIRVIGPKNIDIDEASGGGGQLLVMLPYFLIMGLLQASMFIASDITAGERERQTLEPLLINPVAPSQVVLGKIAINAVAGVCVIALSSMAFLLGSLALPVEKIGLMISPRLFLQVAIGLLPLVFLVAPLMTFLGCFAKTVREAQTWLSVVLIVAVIPSVLQIIMQVRVDDFWLLVPLWSQQYLVNGVLKGAEIAPYAWLLSALGSLIPGFIFAAMASRQYSKPRLILA
ncbi:hypothetical protein NOR51B_370 [Luminiphilus syltensis NOR5-1B]|uniref:ABC-2 type transporter transmembrane domain-containing protein n=2 Tax=Luminiphilus TaxID=1341118 RepID=B8KX54_9GAMM|nr:hypothetical protein NOR51B_370 [Luminiphilus syltensis NOR5-1B]